MAPTMSRPSDMGIMERPNSEAPESPKVEKRLKFSISEILQAEEPKKTQPPANEGPSAFLVVNPGQNSPSTSSKETTWTSDKSPLEALDFVASQAPNGTNLLPNISWTLELQKRFWNERIANRRIGHPYQSRAPPKHKKPRTSFTKSQVAELEERFGEQKYLASTERASVAQALNMSDAQVKTWFQNRRTKWRRQAIEEKEAERQIASKYLQASPYLASAYSNTPSYYARPDVAI